jgi:hypothetical protein
MGLLDMFKKTSEVQVLEIPVEMPLEKSVKPVETDPNIEEQIEKSKVVFGLSSQRYEIDNVHQKTGNGRLMDKELRDIAQYDAIISLIVTTRANQCMTFGTKSRSKYDRGFILRERLPVQDDPSIPADKKGEECLYRTQMAETVSRWILNCGTTNQEVVDHVFHQSDTIFRYCTLSEYLAAQVRNLLIFGRCATQIVRNKEGVPLMFRPIPVETLLRVIDGRKLAPLSRSDKDVPEPAVDDIEEYNALPEGQRPVAYVQRVKGKTVSFFTEQDVMVTYLQKQAYEGLDGYPLSPIELGYFSILMHFHAQMYLQNSFQKGLGSKGFIVIKTPEGGVVSKADVENFRKMFSNYVARNDNSATIPVISGPVEVKFEQLNATAKDLEFNNLYARVLQILCASFQISPHEIGFGALDPGDRSSVSDQMKQEQIVQGEERGLRQLLEMTFSTLFNVIGEAFPDVKKTFYLDAIGLGQNTKEGDLQLYQEELQTNGTFAKIWADSERSEAFPFGGHVPTSPIFHASVAKYMKFGEMREHFFLEKGASKNPAYDFIIDPALDQTYQSLKNQMPQMQAQQQALQLQSQQQQMQMADEQMKQQSQAAEQQSQQQEAQQSQEAEPQQPDEVQQQEMAHADAEETRKQQAHDQKMKHGEDKHQLNLRLAYEESRAQRSANALSGIIHRAKTRPAG